MRVYWRVARLAWLDILEYRFDFGVQIAKYSLSILMLSLIWSAINQSQTPGNQLQLPITTYFFFSAIVYSLSNFHTHYIEQDIKLGYLSKFLVKPVSASLYYLSFQAANAVFELLLKLAVLVPIVWWLGDLPNLVPARVGLFFLYTPFIFWCAFHILSSISLLTFWLTESWSLRWPVMMAARFLAGILVPLQFLPEGTWNWLQWLPFPYFAHQPISILLNQVSYTASFQGLGILISWCVIATLVHHQLWRVGLKKYESTGI
jgi:ABC-2 type transport system permease protein